MLSSDAIATLGKYIIALVILGGSFALIYATPTGTDHTAFTGLIGLIAGWIVRDSAGTSATTNAAKVLAAASPAVGPTDTTP